MGAQPTNLPALLAEEQRLAALAEYRIAGTGPEPAFDGVVAFAADLFDVPVALMSIVGRDRLWLKAARGVEAADLPRSIAFCDRTIEGDHVFVLPDARDDPRFATSPLVTEQGIRFYAGSPLVTPAGHRLGTLCVADRRPRGIDAGQARALRHLARLAMDHMDLRRLDLVGSAALGMADANADAMVALDVHGTITFWNHAAERLFGRSREEMMAKSLDVIIPERLRAAHHAGFARVVAGEPSRLVGKSVECTALRRDGTEFPIDLSLSLWTDRHGLSLGCTIRDISERRQRDACLHRLAHHDPLTGLANRVQFQGRLEETAGTPVAVLLLDLDGFKGVNDSLGHGTGDTLLQALAIRLPAVLPEEAVVARLGGDEFAVLLPGGDPLAAAGAARAVLDAFRKPFIVAGHLLPLGTSVGIALGPHHGRDADALIAAADLALYQAKGEGGRRYRLFEPTMRDQIAAREALHDELRRAIRAGEFELHYQPQVSMAEGRVLGAEALLRWRHPGRGLLAPAAFLPALETHALAAQLGWWILDEACRQNAVWRRAGLAPIRMGVNLFAAQFRAGTLAQAVEEALHRHGLPPDALELEITETIVLRHDDETLAPLRELHASGVGIAFDDFGTGYASLSTLKRFPLTRLKIDRGFVRDLLTDSDDEAIVRAVLAMGHSLGLEVIAEGVETAEQEALLLALGCQRGQGYRYGRALTPDAFAALLGERRAAA